MSEITITITGEMASGKTTLLHKVLLPALAVAGYRVVKIESIERPQPGDQIIVERPMHPETRA